MIFYQEGNSQGNYNYNLRVYKNCECFLHFHKNFEFQMRADSEVFATLIVYTRKLQE